MESQCLPVVVMIMNMKVWSKLTRIKIWSLVQYSNKVTAIIMFIKLVTLPHLLSKSRISIMGPTRRKVCV